MTDAVEQGKDLVRKLMESRGGPLDDRQIVELIWTTVLTSVGKRGGRPKPVSSNAAPNAKPVMQSVSPENKPVLQTNATVDNSAKYAIDAAPGPLTTISDQRSDPDQNPLTPFSKGVSDQVNAVVAHYRTFHPRAYPLVNAAMKVWKLIAGHLRAGHTADELCAAIDGFESDPWHQGENERKAKFTSLALYMRDEEHVVKGLELTERKKRNGESRLSRVEAMNQRKLQELGLFGEPNA